MPQHYPENIATGIDSPTGSGGDTFKNAPVRDRSASRGAPFRRRTPPPSDPPRIDLLAVA